MKTKLTTKGKYALTAILDLVQNSKQGEPVRLQGISERQQISLHYLEQLFRKLRQSGVVKSVRGPGGGYVLAKAAEHTSVFEVLLGSGERITYAGIEEAASKESALVGKLCNKLDEAVGVVLNESLQALSQ